jgi:hypothetical protein
MYGYIMWLDLGSTTSTCTRSEYNKIGWQTVSAAAAAALIAAIADEIWRDKDFIKEIYNALTLLYYILARMKF